MKLDDVVRTRTGKTDRIITHISFPGPGAVYTHRALRDGKPFGPVRWNKEEELILVKEA